MRAIKTLREELEEKSTDEPIEDARAKVSRVRPNDGVGAAGRTRTSDQWRYHPN